MGSPWRRVRFAAAAITALCFVWSPALGDYSTHPPFDAKKLNDMNPTDVVKSIGCSKIKLEELRFPKRVAALYSCDGGLPSSLSIIFRREISSNSPTSFTLTWNAPAMQRAPDRDLAERSVRRVLEVIGVEDVDPIVAEFFRDVPLTGDFYRRDFARGTLKVSVARSYYLDAIHGQESHDLNVSD